MIILQFNGEGFKVHQYGLGAANKTDNDANSEGEFLLVATDFKSNLNPDKISGNDDYSEFDIINGSNW